MFMTFDVPTINQDTCVGYTTDKNTHTDTPVRFRDLVNMETYGSPYQFHIKKENPSVTHIGISIHLCQIKKNGLFKELADTIYSSEVDIMVIQYFEKHVWETAKTHFSNDEKWKLFGYYMTDHARKCLGSTLWNDNCLYYWSNVATTLKPNTRNRCRKLETGAEN